MKHARDHKLNWDGLSLYLPVFGQHDYRLTQSGQTPQHTNCRAKRRSVERAGRRAREVTQIVASRLHIRPTTTLPLEAATQML